MIFDLKNTAIYQAVKLAKHPILSWGKPLRIVFLLLGIALFLTRVALAVFSPSFASSALSDLSLGWAVLFSTLGIFVWYISAFFNLKLSQPKLEHSIYEFITRPDYLNIASFLDVKSAEVCQEALKFAKKYKLEIPPSSALLYYLINKDIRELNFIFSRAEIDIEGLKKALKKEFLRIEKGDKTQDDFKSYLFSAAKIAHSRGIQRIGLLDILISLAKSQKLFEKVLIENDLKAEDIEKLVSWYTAMEKKEIKQKRFWEVDNLAAKGSVARDWASGFSITLDKYAKDLRERIEKTGISQVIGHKQQIEAVERILNKQDLNNVLLVGESGVGRKSIALALAQKAFLGESLEGLNYKRVVEFDASQLSNKVLDECFSEVVRAGNIILVIDNFHSIVENGEDILARFLPLASFQIIAITSYVELHNIVERFPSVLNSFEKVEVPEITSDETFLFLENYVPFFEAKHKRFISYKALREVVELGGRFMQTPFPQSALRLLDEAMVYLVSHSKDKVLMPSHIATIVSEKSEIPVGELAGAEKEKLLNLEDIIHKRIINQDEAVRQIATALRRARAELNRKNGPMGSFLFLGPTGVGKTETSKALADVYFKGEEKMIRLDMSEFQNTSDISRLLGGGEKNQGLLTTPVRENPFSLVLLDELEKAHYNILNLFLQVLDEGFITDGFGRRVDFSHTIIIATSNAGAEIIRQDISEDKTMDMVKEDLLDYLFKLGMYRPEFINRFDGVVIFKPLTEDNLMGIAHLMLDKLRRNLQDKGIKFESSPELQQKIVELSYNPAFGAREMKRVIQEKIENVLAEALLKGQLKRGSRVEINPKNFKLIINNNL